jgi:dienelactone hydrolase
MHRGSTIVYLVALAAVTLAGIGLGGCKPKAPRPTPQTQTFIDARGLFTTHLAQHSRDTAPPPKPPTHVFTVVKYAGPLGPMNAYMTPIPQIITGKRPAVIWLGGGDHNSLGDHLWNAQRLEDDQSAKQLREAGIILMVPGLRGGSQNPGDKEGLYGEVDDVIAAADWLAKQPHVDPTRIFLAGHSTGGTLALLVAATTNKFRCVFSFGPTDDAGGGYARESMPWYNRANKKEVLMRSPVYWLKDIQTPTYIIEGADQPTNVAALDVMTEETTNERIKFIAIEGADHFSILAPSLRAIADKIVADKGGGPGRPVSLTFEDIARAYGLEVKEPR